MASKSKESNEETLVKIKDIHLPFMEKLLSLFEKKKEKSQRHDEFRLLYKVFTTAPEEERLKVYNTNKKKLDRWYKMYEQVFKSKKRSATSENESSQDATESSAKPAKQLKTHSNSNEPSNTPSKPSGSGVSIVSYESVPASNNVSSTSNPSAQPASSTNTAVSSEPETKSDVVTFICASCQFNTQNENEFAQHAKNDHKNELSLWCRQCWRCFSNIGALTAHIKEQSCQKEEMIYRCGVKDCTFEVCSGQTFVHHLRHCHKGSPFIFCVHCQKIFTLPHCLVLHMQNECPYKDRNRKTFGKGNHASETPAPQATPAVEPTSIETLKLAQSSTTVKPAQGSTAVKPAMDTLKESATNPTTLTPIVMTIRKDAVQGYTSSRSRGRGRGRGRVRFRYYESSDSDDPDDPAWMPDPNATGNPVRRSARWAKKVSDARNPEFFEVEANNPRKKSISSAEIHEKNLFSCPCCDFMAAIKSVLEDHYIGIHKAPDKNTCLLCNMKFENVKFFLDHFTNHPKVVAPPEPIIAEAQTKTVVAPKTVESNSVTSKPTTTQASNVSPAPIVTSSVSANSSKNYETETEIFGDDGLQCVVENVVSKDNVDFNNDSTVITIPYQTAIHKKNQKDGKLKKFEDLKSPRDLLTLKEEPHLTNFFKCVMYNCTYTSEDGEAFSFHIDNDHKGRRLHCGYCLTEFFSGACLTEHMMKDHGKRRFQCSNCFYRACSKAHVQIHIKNVHSSENAVIHTCESHTSVDSSQEPDDVTKTWPFICAVGECKFQTFVPQEFKRHNETMHRAVSVFICYYCKVDFISFKRLMDHYRLHGINTFQCTYCVHGSDTKNEILLHLCNAHADKPFRIHFRTAEANVPGGAVQSIRVSGVNGSSTDSRSSEKATVVEEKSLSPAAIPDKQSKVESNKASDNISLPLKAIKQEKDDDSIEDKFFDKIEGKCFPKRVYRISTDFFCGISYCDQQFNDLSDYVGHLKSVHFSVNFSCPHCPTFCDDSVSFKNHLLCHGPNLFACSAEDCSFYDWNPADVDCHLKEHKDSTRLVVRENIDDVSEQLGSSDELAKIQAASFDGNLKENNNCFICPFCDYKSLHQGTMKNHIYQEIFYKRFTCNICDVKLCSRKEVMTHFSTLHVKENVNCIVESQPEIEYIVKKFLLKEFTLTSVTSLTCENCSKAFTDLKHFQHHLSLCLFNNYCPYDCNYCKRSFNDLRLLKFHFDNRHNSNNMSFSVISSEIAELEIGNKTRQIRLKQLTEVLKDKLKENQMSLLQTFRYKSYKCEVCAYSSNFKFDVKKHLGEKHIGTKMTVQKIVKSIDWSISCDIPQSDSSNSISTVSSEKRYRCSYCVKKTFDLKELENHVQCYHPISDEDEYVYFYWPESNKKYSTRDPQLYECGYCNINKANLYSLKGHSDQMHSELAFKVKGYISRHKEINQNIMCGHCYQKLQYNDLKKHTTNSHPSLPLKSISDFQNVTLKRKIGNDESTPKRVKFEPSAVSCLHCRGVFPTVQQVTEHSRRFHSRLGIKYESLGECPKAGDPDDFVFISCEFCSYISSKEYLDKHIATKHKMLMSCTYCGKRFDSGTKLKEHHDSEHKGLKWVIGSSKLPRSSRSSNKGRCEKKITPASDAPLEHSDTESHYGKTPEPVDLSSINFCLRHGDGIFTQLPLVYLFQMYNMNPIVVLKKCKNETV